MAFYRKNKFGNHKTEHLGRSFGSKLEAAGFDMLLAREAAQEIKIIRQQAQIRLTKADILYIADFECFDLIKDQPFYVEIKGYPTDVWAIKKRLYRHYGPAPLEIWMGSVKNLKLDEIIIPKTLDVE